MKKNKISYQGTTTLEVLEGADNYNAWIAGAIDTHVRGNVLEIGAGTGNISDHLKHVEHLVLTDTDANLLKKLRKRFQKESNITVKRLDILSIAREQQRNFTAAYAVNVFEHLDDDRKALLNVNKLLKKDGKFVILVPAKRFAYTRLDKNLGHFRRYEKQELRAKLEEAGFRVEKLYFFNFVGLISWMVRDKIEKNNVQLDASQIALFDRMVPLLRFIESVFVVPIGISLIAVAKKV